MSEPTHTITQTVSDTLHAAQSVAGHAAEHGAEHGAHDYSFAHDSLWTGQDLTYNLLDHHLEFLPDWGTFTLTKHGFILALAAFVLVIFATLAGKSAKKRMGKAPTGLGNFLEVFVKFIRDDVVYPAMGEKLGKHLLNYFLTAFFFILFGNLAGLIPGSKSPTMNIAVTMGMAVMTFILMIYSGVRVHGLWGFLKHFAPPGIPWPVYFILTPIEIVGLFVKPFALTIRLFANMVAGKALVLSFIGLIFMLGSALGAGAAFGIGLLPFAGGVGIMLLEIFVAFLQAFIFTMLSALFIGQLATAHDEHDHEHGHEHAH
ncbi:MAG: F0F1 ATP synthase subunit A [bacterium]|nr:F0F1 ATP synthase subunit A [bacterium]